MATGKYPLEVIIKAVDKVTAPLAAINQKVSRFQAPFRKLSASFAALSRESGFDKLKNSVGNVGSALGKVKDEALSLGKTLAGIAIAGIGGFYALVKSATEGGDALAKTSRRVGLNANAFAEYEFAAKRAGISSEEFSGGLLTFSKNIGMAHAGLGKMAKFLGKVSPELLRQLKGTKSNEEALNLMFKAMARLQDPNKRAALAMAAFGESGQKMTTMVENGTDEIDQLREEFRRLAGDQTGFADQSEVVSDAMDDLGTSFIGARNAALTELLPAVTALIKTLTDLIVKYRPQIQAWAKDFAAKLPERIDAIVAGFNTMNAVLGPVVSMLGAVIEKLGGVRFVMEAIAVLLTGKLIMAVVSLGGAVFNLAATFGGVLFRVLSLVLPLLWQIGAALLTTPIGWLIGGLALVAGGVYLIWKHWDAIVSQVTWLGREIKNLIPDWVKNIFGGGSGTIGPGPAAGADRAAGGIAATGAARSEARVQVDFNNLPQGARVKADPKSDADLDLNMGYSLGMGLP